MVTRQLQQRRFSTAAARVAASFRVSRVRRPPPPLRLVLRDASAAVAAVATAVPFGEVPHRVHSHAENGLPKASFQQDNAQRWQREKSRLQRRGARTCRSFALRFSAQNGHVAASSNDGHTTSQAPNLKTKFKIPYITSTEPTH